MIARSDSSCVRAAVGTPGICLILAIAAARPDAIRFTSIAIWDGVCVPHANKAAAGRKAAALSKVRRFMIGILSGLCRRLPGSRGICVPGLADVERNEIHDGIENPVCAGRSV